MSLAAAGYMTGLLPAVGIISVVIGGCLTIKIKARRPFFILPGDPGRAGRLSARFC